MVSKRTRSTISRGLFDAAGYMELRRLPELFCGFQWRKRHAPTLYPVACIPQAWAAASVFALVQASLGLSFADGADRSNSTARCCRGFSMNCTCAVCR